VTPQKINDIITRAMESVENNNGQRIQWFYAFGTLLNYVRKRTLAVDQDIDIGVIYGETEAHKIIKGITNAGFQQGNKIVNDITKEPLNVHFTHPETPSIDLFFFVEKNNILYHTYDLKKEMREIPAEYHFKGVEKQLIMPSKETIEKSRKGHPEGDQILTNKGVWKYDIYGNHSGNVFHCPFAYGTLLDIWYPGWIVEEKHYGQSRTDNVKTVKSCKDL